MKKITILTITICCAFITGCASNVVFYDTIEKDIKTTSANKKAVKVYVDAFGSIYPEEKGIGLFSSELKDSASLYDQFLYHKKICENGSFSKKSDIRALCHATKDEEYTNADNESLPIKAWRNVQTVLWQKKGKEIFQHATIKDRNLLFLIHGFNNYPESARENFSLIREKITALTGAKKAPLFIEVYWDGFKGLPLSGSWSSAQASGPLVGFQMRQLFKAVQLPYINSKKNLPELMFVTHSSGAFVVGSILGNPYSALPELYENEETSAEYRNFRKHRAGKNKKFPIPAFPKIRVGMVAAATPSNTFTGNKAIDGKIEGGILSKNTTLIFTINGKDLGLNKFFGLANVNPTGATGAGADKELYCNELKQVKGQDSKAFDFTDGGFLFWNAHGMAEYLGRKNSENFLKEVLNHKVNYQFDCGLS